MADPMYVQVQVGGGVIKVDPESCPVKANKNWVEWEGNEPFSIAFENTGIAKPTGGPDGKKYRVKSKVFGDAHLGKNKYTITSGSIVLDPEVEVLPGP